MGSSTRFILLLTTPLTLLHPRPSLLRLTRLSLSPLTLSRPSSLLPIKSTHHHHHIHSQAATSSSSPLIDDNFGDYSQQHSGFSPNPRASHPWPEWSRLIHALSTVGYFDQHRFGGDGIDDEYVAYENLSEEFVRAASACLAFARNRSDILGSLSRRDIEVIVENGTPFLFKSALDSARRMRSFLSSGRTNVRQTNFPF